MPAKSDLEKMLDLVQQINRSEGVGLDLATFAEQVLAAVRGYLPTARVVRLYRVNGDDAEVLAATVPGVDRIKLAADQVYSRALYHDQPEQDSTTGIWAVPISRSGQALGLLEIGFAPDVPTPPNLPDRLRLIAAALVGSFDRLQSTAAPAAADPMQDRLRTLTILNDLAMRLASTRDEDDLLHESARVMAQALQIDHCGIVLLDRSGRFGRVVADYPDFNLTGAVFDVQTNPLYAEAWQRAMPVYVEDVQTDPRIDPTGREVMQQSGVQAMLLLPLVDSQGQLIGSFSIDNYNQRQPFTEERQRIAQTIAAQVVIGLQNIWLLRDSQRQAEQLRVVNVLSQRLQTRTELVSILDVVLAESQHIVPLDRLYIALHDPEADTLHNVALLAHGERYLTLTGGAPLSLADSFAGQVLRAGGVVHIADTASADANANDLPEMRSLVGLPLAAGGQTFGALCIGHYDPYTYTDTDMVVLQQLAGLLATAIEQARQSDLSTRQARSEALINDISARLQQQIDVSGMLQVTAEQLGQALGARKAHIHLQPPAGDQE